jgi:serine O-acetyltransferase
MAFMNNLCNDLKTYRGDWACQGFWVMAVYRFGRWRYTIGNSWVRKLFSLQYKVLYKAVQVITGVEFPCEVEIGRNFRIDHFGGIIISGYATFGDNCIIRNGVTIGLQDIDHPVAPRIGNNVEIGAGAKLLGDIVVGDNVTIGANAVVIKSVPPDSIAVGVPAHVRPKKDPTTNTGKKTDT